MSRPARRANRNTLPGGLPLLIGTAVAVFVSLVLVAAMAGGAYRVIRERREPAPVAESRPVAAPAPVPAVPARSARHASATSNTSPAEPPAATPAPATPPTPPTPPTLDNIAYAKLRAAYRDNRINAASAYVGTRWRFKATFREFGFHLNGRVQTVVAFFGGGGTYLYLTPGDASQLHAGSEYLFDGDIRFVSTVTGVIEFENVALAGIK